MKKKKEAYSGEFKIQVVEYYLNNKTTYRKTYVKYFIDPNENNNIFQLCPHRIVKRWVDLYKNEGKERLMEDRRKKKLPKEPIQPVNVSQKAIVIILSRLKKVRLNSKLTSRELSRLIGKSVDYIAKMEQTDSSFLPSFKTFLAILTACKISPSCFFADTDYTCYLNDKEFIKQILQSSPEQRQAILEILQK